LAVAAVTLLLPLLPLAAPLGLTPMPPSFLLLLTIILAGYVVTAEFAKRRFYGNAKGL
jgi:Mg2+-importing ATPase